MCADCSCVLAFGSGLLLSSRVVLGIAHRFGHSSRICALHIAPVLLTGPSCNCAARSWHSAAQFKYPIAPKLGLSRAHESEGSGPGSVRPAKLATREAADAQACAGPVEPDDVGDSVGNYLAWHLSGASSARNRPAPSFLAQWHDGLVTPPLGSRSRGPRAFASPWSDHWCAGQPSHSTNFLNVTTRFSDTKQKGRASPGLG